MSEDPNNNSFGWIFVLIMAGIGLGFFSIVLRYM